jgi:hypothetical protein
LLLRVVAVGLVLLVILQVVVVRVVYAQQLPLLVVVGL